MIDLNWSGNKRDTTRVSIGMSGEEHRTLQAVADQLSDEIDAAASCRTNGPVGQVIRAVANGSLSGEDLDTPIEPVPESRRLRGQGEAKYKGRLSLPREEYRSIDEGTHWSDLDRSDFNTRPINRKLRQTHLIPFFEEVGQ